MPDRTPMPPRKPITPEAETAVLAKSARRCALCFHLNGDLMEKLGQIAHLGGRDNPAEDNLCFMCLEHHTLFDSTTSQHKNYTTLEVKGARERLYSLVAEGKYLTPSAALPFRQAEVDGRTLRNFLEVVPSNGTIRFLRTNNFAGFSFDWGNLEDIERFVADYGGPDREFLDSELETARLTFRNACRVLLGTLARNTWTTNNENRQSVPEEWETDQPARFHNTVREIHAAADAVCTTYDALVRLARSKLAV
jgi:hypothetical protein